MMEKLEHLKEHLKGIIADIHPSVRFGKNSFVWSFAVIGEGVEIGDNCVVGAGTYIGKNVKIGNNVRIQTSCFIVDNMNIEDNVFIGPCVSTTDDKYPISNNPGYDRCPPILENGCSIGANCTILPGVRIGRNAMVGAGSVVTKDVPANGTVMMGTYAKEKTCR